MYNKDPFRFWHLFWRCWVPSPSTLIGGSVLACAIIGAHLVYLCANFGAILPNLSSTFSINWPPQTVSSLRPLRTVVHSSAFDITVLVLTWLVVGLLTYTAVLYVVRMLRALRGGSQIYVPTENHVIYNPLRNATMTRLLWHAAIIVVALVVTLLFGACLHFVWDWDMQMYEAANFVDFLRYGAFGYLVLLGMFHVYITLCRLFLSRTRILGEIVH